MSAIEKLCQRCILLKDGRIEEFGETGLVVKNI